MIGMAHYGGTEGLLERGPDEIARAIEAYEHAHYLAAKQRKRR